MPHQCALPAARILDGLALRNVSEEFQDAALELDGLEAESGGVECAGDFPELLLAAGGGIDAFGVAAGEGFVFFVADEEDGESARGDGSFGRDFGDGKAGEFFAAIKQRPAKGRENRFAEQRRAA